MNQEPRRTAACWAAGATMLMLVLGTSLRGLEFGIPKPVPAPFNVGGIYGYEYLPADGRTIYFASNFEHPDSLGAFDMYISRRASITNPWEAFEILPPTINTPERAEFAPSLTADGQQLYFMRTDSPLGLGNGDLYVSHKQSDGSWGTAQPLQFNTPQYIEAYPTISPDGLTLYFNTLVNDTYPHPPELFWNTYVARRDSSTEPFGTPEYFFGGYGAVSQDGLKHIFLGYGDVANYYGLPRVNQDVDMGDLYIRTRDTVSGPWGPPELLKPPLSASGLECCGFFSEADSSLYFVGDRPGTDSTGLFGFVDMWRAPLAESGLVDVDPGGSGPIDWRTQSILSAAILTTDTFNALKLDTTTLVFGDPLLIADGATPVPPTSSASADVNGDGLLDLTLEFSIPDMLANGLIGFTTEQGYLAGQSMDGMEIAGRDNVMFIPEPGGLLAVIGVLLLVGFRKR